MHVPEPTLMYAVEQVLVILPQRVRQGCTMAIVVSAYHAKLRGGAHSAGIMDNIADLSVEWLPALVLLEGSME